MKSDKPKTARRLWQLAKLIAGLAMIGWLSYYLFHHAEQLRGLYVASWPTLVATGLAVIATWLLMSAQGFLLLRTLDVRIGFWEHSALQFASILVNYLPIRLGPVLKLHYLRRVHQVPIAHFGSLLMVRAILLMAACGLLGLGGALALKRQGQPVAPELFLLFAALIIGTATLSFLPLSTLPLTERLRPLKLFFDGIERVREKPKMVLALIALLILQLAVVALRLFWTYGAVRTDVSATVVTTVAAVAALVNLLAFTMGSLGVREAAIGWATEAVGFDFSRGVFAGLVDRAVLIVLAYALGACGLFWVRRRLRQFEADEENPP